MDALQKHKDKPLYEVPDFYFEQLQRNVMQRVTKEEKHQKTQRKWFSFVSAAASIALIFMLSYFVFMNKDTAYHFYVHEEIAQPETTILTLDLNNLAEATELKIQAPIEFNTHFAPKTSLEVAENNNKTTTETIVYSAVEFYIDDYETSTFFDVMYDLEVCYEY